jgi:gas vesicle structural protein
MAAGRQSADVSQSVLGDEDASLLDIVDNVLSKGVVLSGDLTIALAQVDLIYARISLLLCAADRVLPNEGADFFERRDQRQLTRRRRKTKAASPSLPNAATVRKRR